MHAGDLNLRTNLHCSRQILTLAAAWSCAATSSTNAFNGVGCHHAPRLPRSNPHSARSTTACHFPRFPSLEAFGRRPQASVSAAPSVIGRHPKPLYERGVVKTLSALLVYPLDLFVRPQAPIFSSRPWCRSSTARKIAQGRRVGAAEGLVLERSSTVL